VSASSPPFVILAGSQFVIPAKAGIQLHSAVVQQTSVSVFPKAIAGSSQIKSGHDARGFR
jgi:hypothetical protein